MRTGAPPPAKAMTAEDILSNSAPKSEAGTATAGTGSKASRMDHTHPPISWRGRVTLGADGTAVVTFGRSFASAPVIQLTVINPTGARVVPEQVNDIKTGALWTGATISGTRARPLPTMLAVSGLLGAVITGINALVTALSGFNVFSDPAAGVVVNVTAVEPSPPAT
jgi:hypothetical protein